MSFLEILWLLERLCPSWVSSKNELSNYNDSFIHHTGKDNV